MLDQLARLNEPQLVFLAVMATLALTAIVIVAGIVAVQVRRLRERQLDLGFREELLRRGLSVDEAVRLLTARRPTWSESLMSVGDWALAKVSRGYRNVVELAPHVTRPCRRLLRATWEKSAALCRMLSREGPVWLRTAWRHTSRFCRSLWRDARPVIRWTMKSLNAGLHWLGNQTDRLVRRLAPHRP